MKLTYADRGHFKSVNSLDLITKKQAINQKQTNINNIKLKPLLGKGVTAHKPNCLILTAEVIQSSLNKLCCLKCVGCDCQQNNKVKNC